MLDLRGNSTVMVQRAPTLPIDKLVVGTSTDAVAELLPRLFNLCRAAQSAAVDTALGRPISNAGIKKEILRDHLLKFHATWPGFFGSPPIPLPANWADGGRSLGFAVFGETGRAPKSCEAFDAFLRSDALAGHTLSLIADCFQPGEAVANGLPMVAPETIFANGLVENSVGSRHADHPVMRAIDEDFGRGPLWRAAARLYDIEMVIDMRLPEIVQPEPGSAVVPATRGAYGVRVKVCDDIVTDFERVTPTDHLLADGGAMDRTSATLPADKAGLHPLVLDILDPCSPVRLKEVGHA
ncbi:MAG: hydrogenase expression/formation protein HupK [Paracoccaceae bacterium]|nr:hydrogenase expression/formation protein HupK [Paracoccaceae bacterium]